MSDRPICDERCSVLTRGGTCPTCGTSTTTIVSYHGPRGVPEPPEIRHQRERNQRAITSSEVRGRYGSFIASLFLRTGRVRP